MRTIAKALELSKSNLITKLKTPKERAVKKEGDEELLSFIREVIQERATYGYRRVTVLVNDKLKKMGRSCVNRKRIYRVMKQHKLLLQKPSLKPQRSHDGKVETLHSNTRWCSDTFCIQCLSGEKVYVAFSIDTCDREVMRYIASTKGIDGETIRDLMVETVEYRLGKPQVTHRVAER